MGTTESKSKEASVAAGYEVSDAAIKPMNISIGATTAFCMLFFVLMWGFWELLEVYRDMSDPAPSVFVEREEAPLPRLQIIPNADYQDLKKKEAAMLESYSWVNKDASLGQIPIERAKFYVNQRSLPSFVPVVEDADENEEKSQNGKSEDSQR